MNERWRRINDLFHLALDRAEHERQKFLDEACAGDPELAREVQSLLAAHSSAGQFLEGDAAYASPSESADRMVAREVGQYRIERVLGRGGMGVVYLAEDTRLGRRVALKAISPEYTHDIARRERLRREARAAAVLSHPGIATIYALEEFGDDVFIAAEYVAGETLREEIARGRSTAAHTIDTAIALASALAAAHDAGITHRDLKPENIIRTPGGVVKILDFGLAQMADTPERSRLTLEGSAIGTPAYMAPEQIRRGRCDGRTDLFALGIVMYELLTGANPFSGRDTPSTIARVLETEPAFTSFEGPAAERTVNETLMAIIRTCLAKSPAGRFASAHVLRAALEEARRGGSGRIPVPLPAGAALRWWRFHQAATCATYAALMLPLWFAQTWIGGRWGRFVFVAGLVATVAATTLRLHLWFASSSLPAESRSQRNRSHAYLRTSEFVLVGVLVVAGVLVLDSHAAVGATLVAAAVAVFLSFLLIEPATTRAAFPES